MHTQELLEKAINQTKQGLFDDAIVNLGQLLTAEPENLTALHLAAIVNSERGDHPMVIECSSEYLKYDQKNPGIYSLLAFSLLAEKKYGVILEIIEPFADILTEDSTIQHACGIANLELGNIRKAIAYLEITKALKPDDANTYNMLGLAYSRSKQCLKAIEYYKHGLSLDPEHGTLHINIGLAYMQVGLIEQSVAFLEKSLLKNPIEEHAAILHGLIFAKQHDINATNEEFKLLAKKAYDLAFKAIPKKQPVKNPLIGSTGYKIRIGYVSGDMRQHPCGDFIANIVNNHDYDNFEVYCYDNKGKQDLVNKVIRENCTGFRDISQLSDAEVLEQIEIDGIDALVDVSGITDYNRMRVFAAKPCFLQLLWIGYFGTLGMPEMDYLFGDHTTLKEGDESWYHEALYKLPYSYLPGEPYGIDHETRELPFDRNGYITFAAFNKLPKITPHVISYWAQILNRVENSKIFFKNTHLGEDAVKEMLIAEFAKHGVSKDRLILEAASPRNEFLDRYNEVDISLDSFPYGGGVSTIEPLLMGVPVITWDGDRWMCRASASYLNTLGHQELVAQSLDEYVDLAVDLAAKPERIREYRNTLRSNIRSSEINARNHVKHFEEAISKLLTQDK